MFNIFLNNNNRTNLGLNFLNENVIRDFFREILQSLPPQIQSQIASERDPERKKQIFNAAVMQQQVLPQ